LQSAPAAPACNDHARSVFEEKRFTQRRKWEMPGANSYLFLSNGPEVAAAVRAFAPELPK